MTCSGSDKGDKDPEPYYSFLSHEMKGESEMKAVRYSVPVFLIIVSIFYLIHSINLPTDSLSNPSEPIYFPLFVSSGLGIFSIIYLIQEIRKDEEYEEIKHLFSKKVLLTIGVIVVASILYTIVFERLGFLYSGILFLGIVLFYLNGLKKWILNIAVSVLASVILWYAFSELLNVNLP